jgi:hypothetical protein
MHQYHIAVPLRSLVLSLALLAACGPSEQELQQQKDAAADSAEARRWAVIRGFVERDIQTAEQHCRESVDELRALLTKDSSLTWQKAGHTEPFGDVARAMRNATLHHDSTKSCAPLADSVTRTIRKARGLDSATKPNGPRR